MSRYTLTLPPGETRETITFTPVSDGDQFPLIVQMAFRHAGPLDTLQMFGFGETSPFADGLEIEDSSGGLKSLTLSFPATKGWLIKVSTEEGGTPVTLNGSQTFDVSRESGVPQLFIQIESQAPHRLRTGDPKIKVIRPSTT